MKKKLFIIISGLFFFCTGSFAQVLQDKIIYKAEISFMESEQPVISIFHIPIERVSVNIRTMVATGTVVLTGVEELSSVQSEAITVQYYTDDDSIIKTSNATYQKISENTYSFITDPILIDANSEYIYYRIAAKASDGTIGRFPPDDSFIEANLKQMKTQSIGPEGSVLTLQSGDQRRGNTLKYFAAGVLLSPSNFRIKELYTSESLPFIGNQKPVIAYEFTPADIVVNSQSLMPSITMYYGDLAPNMNNIEVKWLNGTVWENVNFTNDTGMRTVTVNLPLTNTKLGYYAIFDKLPLGDSDYRPSHRVLRFGESLKFRNLEKGDIVTILDISGRSIRKLTKAPFEWDGRKDNGSYAESGSYIYQIKAKGKIISGSTVFVR